MGQGASRAIRGAPNGKLPLRGIDEREDLACCEEDLQLGKAEDVQQSGHFLYWHLDENEF